MMHHILGSKPEKGSGRIQIWLRRHGGENCQRIKEYFPSVERVARGFTDDLIEPNRPKEYYV